MSKALPNNNEHNLIEVPLTLVIKEANRFKKGESVYIVGLMAQHYMTSNFPL